MRFLCRIHVDWVFGLILRVVGTIVCIAPLFAAPPEQESQGGKKDDCDGDGDGGGDGGG